MHIHLVRNVWASEYFATETTWTTAADLLGDSLETVMRHYVDPLRKQATEAADRFVREAKKRQRGVIKSTWAGRSRTHRQLAISDRPVPRRSSAL